MKWLFFLFVGFLISSCNTIRVFHISEVKKIKNNYWIYALPKTEIFVDVVLEKKLHIKGPYAEFASKYLGIANVPLKSFEEYSIKDIKIQTSFSADSEQVFVVDYSKKLPWNSIQQTFDAVILSLNSDFKQTLERKLFNNNKTHTYRSFDDLLYKEVSKKPFVVEKIDTVYKQVRVDTIWTRIPVQRKSVDTLKIEDKAKEAAKVIFELRSRMYDLFTGEFEFLPQDEAAESIANELRMQEQEYLELFLGKTFITNEIHRFKVIPKADDKNTYVLTLFSEKKGLISNIEKDSEPIVLQITSSQTFVPATFQILKLEKAKLNPKVFYFKIPNKAMVRITYDNETLLENEILYYQTGRIQKIPIKYLKQMKINFAHDNLFFQKIKN